MSPLSQHFMILMLQHLHLVWIAENHESQHFLPFLRLQTSLFTIRSIYPVCKWILFHKFEARKEGVPHVSSQIATFKSKLKLMCKQEFPPVISSDCLRTFNHQLRALENIKSLIKAAVWQLSFINCDRIFCSVASVLWTPQSCWLNVSLKLTDVLLWSF